MIEEDMKVFSHLCETEKLLVETFGNQFKRGDSVGKIVVDLLENVGQLKRVFTGMARDVIEEGS